ncbi:carbohydrate sulfotransferase 1-like [Ruditapes philippinarum]|uniref:carbohydrate sulfotransferase 1-like n=1 Tax=Ruditapes philippinarum TaxID=129788 RepID=UPI00295AC6A5|nr:carbohydrate sulfotransferase 1-like [Ruditapes philippinarum]
MLEKSFKKGFVIICFMLIINAIYTWIKQKNNLTDVKYNLDMPHHKTKENLYNARFKKIIIIIAYGRSGSTFLGSILQETMSTFYLYEPFRALKYLHQKQVGKYSLSSDSPWMHYSLFGTEKKAIYAFNLWVNCSLSSICLPQLRDEQSTPNVHGCCGKRLSRNKIDTSNLSCLYEEERYCQNSTIQIFKFIRMRMKLVLQLLHLFPNIKVIHLVRDPRGIFNSIMTKTKPTVQMHSAVNFCENLKNDLAYSKLILKQYPNKLYVVSYEDLANNPIRTAKDIFQFANLRFTNAIIKSILLKTQSDKDTCRFCVIRKNSTETSFKWRSTIDVRTASIVYKTCKFSNQLLGYLPLTDENSLRNVLLPSRKLGDVKKNILSNKHLHV